MVRPSSLSWTGNNPRLIPFLLSAIMTGMGMTLTPADFSRVLGNPTLIAGGVACQYGIMPLAAAAIAAASGLPPAAALGVILVGCSPGGTASNLVAMISRADVALSVCLTAASTLLAAAFTPAAVKLLSARHLSAEVAVDGAVLCAATCKVILGPVLLGMIVNRFAPGAAMVAGRFTPFASALLVGLICGGVVAQNASALTVGGPGLVALGAVTLLHCIGFSMGYILPRRIGKCSRRTSRTISIETGMQNSALAVVLAQSLPGISPIAALPGALSATVHSCVGSLLAIFWRKQDRRNGESEE